jgi:hypothetical protein
VEEGRGFSGRGPAPGRQRRRVCVTRLGRDRPPQPQGEHRAHQGPGAPDTREGSRSLGPERAPAQALTNTTNYGICVATSSSYYTSTSYRCGRAFRVLPLISSWHTDLQRAALLVDRQIGEIRRDSASGAPYSLRNKDKSSAVEVVQRAIYKHFPRPRHAYEEYVYLVVHVIPDTFSLGEVNQVDVEVRASLKTPDNACTPFGGAQYLCNPCVIFRRQFRVLVSQTCFAYRSSEG